MKQSHQQPVGGAHAPQSHMPQSYTLTSSEFERLRDRLARFSGVYLDATRQRMLEHGLARRLLARGCTYAQYEQILTIDREELARLSELVLNHETFFFRNQPHMRALHDVILPELNRHKPPGEPIRIWSAGCATGEEAYSLAIAVREAFPLSTRPIQIWATDLSAPALALAREGCYSGRALVNLAPEILARYFDPSANGYAVNERVRALVQFERYNLLDPPPPTAQGIDIIFCQNVIIYFQAATAQLILRSFYDLLSEGGMLFLGFSETLWNRFDAFHTREVLGAFVYYKEAYTPATKRELVAIRASETRHAATRALVPTAARARPKPPQELKAAGEPAQAEALLRQSETLVARGRVTEALAVLRRISPASGLAVAAMLAIARLQANSGQADLALAEAKRIVEHDPLHHEATMLLGILYSQQGQWDMAVLQFERARYLNSAAPLVSFHLAEAYRQKGRAEAAAREYRNALRKLQPLPPDTVIDGVAVGWLRDTCQQHLTQLSQRDSEH